MEILIAALKSDSFRRAVAFGAGFSLPILNGKLHLGLSEGQVTEGVIFAAGYIAQSVSNDMHSRATAAKAAAAVVTVPQQIAAMKALGEVKVTE